MNNTESLKSRIIVAAGGGGYVNYNNKYGNNEVSGSSGGALEASKGGYSQCLQCSNSEAKEIELAEGGSQTSGGKISTSEGGLGYGGNSYDTIGGGGGYFGGSGGSRSTHRNGSGAGGSSFISGHSGCHAFGEKSSNETSSSSTVHYSGHYFINTEMKSGDETFLSPEGQNEKGHFGDGFIRITAVSFLIQTKHSNIIKIHFSFLFIFFNYKDVHSYC